ncbi:DUF6115 domain-containing protein [Brevibacillus dissolubilis]|uniref:DUF6115 domain-containing protein n=1 Tax=Brevibacillus dissolubilis TaxID=1844116 RepID=UPI001116CCB8|nr:hypothetical protein [Brevibacillus dissolubilis]
MDQPHYLLLGAGVLIVILSFLLKKPAQAESDATQHLAQKQVDLTGMEQTLKRFVKQVKQENEQVMTSVRHDQERLQSELSQMHTRVAALEEELSRVSGKLTSLSTVPAQPQHTTPNQEPTADERVHNHADTLLLKERYRRVFELKKEGLDIAEIAKRLGAGRGEIELIFSLAEPLQGGQNNG